MEGMYDDAGHAQSHAFGISRRGPVSDTTMWHAGKAFDGLQERMRAFVANECPAGRSASEDVDASKPVAGKAETNLKFVHGCTLQTIGHVNGFRRCSCCRLASCPVFNATQNGLC